MVRVRADDVLPRSGDELAASDLASLGCINEASVLATLMARLKLGQEYTSAGVLLVAVNPRCRLTCRVPRAVGQAGAGEAAASHGTQLMVAAYELGKAATTRSAGGPAPSLGPGAERPSGERIAPAAGLSSTTSRHPHIFSVVDEAMREAGASGSAHAIVLAGEAGSGKSTVAAQALRYLAVASVARKLEREGTAAADAVVIAASDLSCSVSAALRPSAEHILVTAFEVVTALTATTAPGSPAASTATLRVQAAVNGAGRMNGARIDACLVGAELLTEGTSLGPGCRSMRILYQMVAGLDAAEKQRLGLGSPLDFALLDCQGYGPAQVIEDAHSFQGVVHGLKLCGMSLTARAALWQTLAAVLHLGQLNPVAPATPEAAASLPGGAVPLIFENAAAASLASRLLGLTGRGQLLKALHDGAIRRAAKRRPTKPSGASSRPASYAVLATGADIPPEAIRAEALILARELFVAAVDTVISSINDFIEDTTARHRAAPDGDGPLHDSAAGFASSAEGTSGRREGPSFGRVVILDGPGLSAVGRRTPASAHTTVASFAAMLTNYTAERVESAVRGMTLELDMSVYDDEAVDVGIPREAIPAGNEAVLKLFEDRAAPPGIFAILQETAQFNGLGLHLTPSVDHSRIGPASPSGVGGGRDSISALAAGGSGQAGTGLPAAQGGGSLAQSTPPARPRAAGRGGPPSLETRLEFLSRSPSFTALTLPRSARASGEAAREASMRVSRARFAIAHTHGPVAYSTAGWMRGVCTLAWTGIGEVLATSIHPFVARLGRALRDDAKHAEATGDATPTISRLLDWLADDEALLHESEPHVVRCMATGDSFAEPRMGEPDRVSLSGPGEPTVVRRPSIDASAVLSQISSSALPPAVAMRAHGFPFRSPCADFYERYVIISRQILARHGPALVAPVAPGSSSDDEAAASEFQRSMCEMLAAALFVTVPALSDHTESVAEMLQVGHTRVFLTGRALSALEAARSAVLRGMERAAVRIQTHVRSLLVRSDVRHRWQSAIAIQSLFRCWRERQAYLYFRFHAVVVARFLAGRFRRRAFIRARWAATMVKAAWRRRRRRTAFLRLREAAVSVHVLARGFLVRHAILSRHKSLLVMQRAVREFLVRNRVRWARIRAVLLMQALLRGYLTRRADPQTVAHIREFRVKVAKLRFFRHVVATWRGRMVRRRLLQMVQAARSIQRWFLSQMHRARFWRAWAAAIRVQAVFRGALARRAVANVVAINLAAEQAWSVQRLRAAERPVLDAVASTLHSAAFWKHIATADPGLVGLLSATKSAAYMTRPLDVDVISDGGPHGVAALNAAENLEDGAEMDSAELALAGLPEPDELARQLTQNHGSASWSAAHEVVETTLARQGRHTVAVAAGSTHSVVLDSVGRVHAWGWNDRGQLGTGRPGVASTTPVFVTALSHGTGGYRPAVVPAWTPRTRVVAIAAGSDHTVAVSSTGVAYTWGANSHGQCGLGHFADVAKPTGVMDMRRRVSSAVAGSRHTVFLTSAGSLYACGERNVVGVNAGGATSAPSREGGWGGDVASPVGVAALSLHKIEKIAAGWQHTLALATTGEVFAWGEGSRGQLGWGRRGSRPLPCLVDLFPGPAADPDDAGIDREVQVGKLGHAREPAIEELKAAQDVAQRVAEARAEKHAAMLRREELSLSREERLTMKALLTPSAAAASAANSAAAKRSPSVKCIDVACGGSHSLALTADGVVIAFGSNDCGQLGLGDLHDRLVPCAVPRGWAARGDTEAKASAGSRTGDSRVASIAAGWRSSCAVTASHDVYTWGHCGASAEPERRQELGLALDGADPDTFLARIVHPSPVRMQLAHAEGFLPVRVMATGSPLLSASLVTFSARRITDDMVCAAMARVADEAESIMSDSGRPDESQPGQMGQLSSFVAGSPGAAAEGPSPEADEAEVVGAMLAAHPELRHSYARSLIAARKREQAVRAARAKAMAAGLTLSEVESLVEQAAAWRTDDELAVDAAKTKVVADLQLRQRFAVADGRTPEVFRGMGGVGARHLAGRWSAMSLAHRFAALGLEARHLDLMTPEQLARLAFAIRQPTYAAAWPFLSASLGVPDAIKTEETAVHHPEPFRRGDGHSRRSPRSRLPTEESPDGTTARPRWAMAGARRDAGSPGASDLSPRSRAEHSPSTKSSPPERRGASQARGHEGGLHRAESHEAAAAWEAEGASRLRQLKAALSVSGPGAEGALSRGASRSSLGHGAPSGFATRPSAQTGILLPGGRFDTVMAQRRQLEQLEELHRTRQLKQNRAADKGRRAAAWRRLREGSAPVDVAGFFSADKLVAASRKLTQGRHGKSASLSAAWRPTAGTLRVTASEMMQGTTAALIRAVRSTKPSPLVGGPAS